ncbi:MAG: 16S rRNA (uracil(1498)-N(3))-methyltransferase [Burkholderiaceae bacterium]|nr:16S rRNA (uracil(1498)-N(3))-methyltransferase [Burkholderiaceae bacterium]
MPSRLHVDTPLQTGVTLLLPPSAARHAQVLRLQPGAELTLFNGLGGEWAATVTRMGRSEVEVMLGAHDAVERELPQAITLALAMPANDRMDFLVEKATELGVTAIQPLMSERSVLRLAAERAEKKINHWQGVAIAACEQSGRTRVPQVAPVRTLAQWLAGPEMPAGNQRRWLLSPTAARPLPELMQQAGISTLVLSGPEGGLSPAEEEAARARGFEAASLGPRILRADTAPLAVLAWLGLQTS